MRFKTLKIKNFLSYGGEHEVSLDRQGLVGVFGENGAGKSSIYTALVWCLWGNTIRGLKSDEVINNRVGKDCEVSLTIEDGSDLYEITRFRARNSKNGVDIIINGTPAAAGIIRDSQVTINQLIGLDFNTFVQSVLMSSQTQSFCVLPDSKQKEVLEDILGLDILRRAQAIVKKKLQEAEYALSSLLSEKEVIEDHQKRIKYDIEHFYKKHEEFTKVNESDKNRLLEALQEAKKQHDEAEKAAEDLKTATQGMQVLKDTRDSITSEISKVLKEVESLNEKVEINKDKINNKQVESETIIATYRRLISSMSDLAGKACAACKQPVNMDYAEDCVSTYEKEIASHKQKLTKLDALTNRLDAALKKDIEPLNTKIVELRKNLKENSDKEAEVLLRQSTLYTNSAQLPSIKNTINLINMQLERKKSETSPYKELIQKSESELESNNSEYITLKHKIASQEIDVVSLRFWERGFGNKGLKSYIMDGVIPFLNERAQTYADIMSDGKLKIKFSTQSRTKAGALREKFQVEVTNALGAEIYKGNSAGEKRRVDVAIGWALADLAATKAQKPIRFRGLDETFEHLDSAGIDAVFKLLNHSVGAYETVFVVTHNEELRNRFTNELLVSKNAGFSKITSTIQ